MSNDNTVRNRLTITGSFAHVEFARNKIINRYNEVDLNIASPVPAQLRHVAVFADSTASEIILNKNNPSRVGRVLLKCYEPPLKSHYKFVKKLLKNPKTDGDLSIEDNVGRLAKSLPHNPTLASWERHLTQEDIDTIHCLEYLINIMQTEHMLWCLDEFGYTNTHEWIKKHWGSRSNAGDTDIIRELSPDNPNSDFYDFRVMFTTVGSHPDVWFQSLEQQLRGLRMDVTMHLVQTPSIHQQ